MRLNHEPEDDGQEIDSEQSKFRAKIEQLE